MPLLFGVAGLVIGLGYPLLDEQLGGSWAGPPAGGAPQPATPSWAKVLVCIALFALQYGASGALEAPLRGPGALTPPLALDALLCLAALATYRVFDRTPAGLALSLATALGGPGIEVALINGPHLYAYSHPDWWGIPSWIPWVYFAGGPAVGLLGRRVAAELRRELAASGPPF